MTRSSAPTTYDDDFYAWTQEQAAALRALPPGAVGDDVDIAHVAEEIEDMGRRDLREVTSFLDRLFEHLLKIEFSPESSALIHWRAEARVFQNSAIDAYSPSMRRLVDLERPWRRGRRRAHAFFEDAGVDVATPNACPFTIDDLLGEDFDVDNAIAKIADAMQRGEAP